MERQRRLRRPNPRTSQEMATEPNPPPQPEPEPPQPKARKPRGSNNGREAQSEPSKRPQLTIVGFKEFDSDPDCSKIPTTIRLIVCSNVNGPYTKFNEFPMDDRKQCLEEFLERYRWAGDPVECEKVFHRISCDKYSDALTVARRQCRKKHGNNCQKWKELRPDWLENQEAWNSMCDEWEKPSWQQLSDQNSSNRKAPGNVVNHVAGTRSTFRHAKKMKRDNGVEPTYEELFRETHVKKLTGEFCDSKSQEVLEKFAFYKANPESPEEGDQEKWIRAVGGASHGRVYGVGGLIDVSKVIQNKRSRSDPASSQPPITSPQHFYTQEEVDARIREERRCNFELFANVYNHLGLSMPTFVGVSSEASVESVQEGNVNEQADGPIDEE